MVVEVFGTSVLCNYGASVDLQLDTTQSSSPRVTQVTRANPAQLYLYDASGNRVVKRYSEPSTTLEMSTWYVRDAQGNTMAIYTKPSDSSTARLTEALIYGSSRIGVARLGSLYSSSMSHTAPYDQVNARVSRLSTRARFSRHSSSGYSMKWQTCIVITIGIVFVVSCQNVRQQVVISCPEEDSTYKYVQDDTVDLVFLRTTLTPNGEQPICGNCVPIDWFLFAVDAVQYVDNDVQQSLIRCDTLYSTVMLGLPTNKLTKETSISILKHGTASKRRIEEIVRNSPVQRVGDRNLSSALNYDPHVIQCGSTYPDYHAVSVRRCRLTYYEVYNKRIVIPNFFMQHGDVLWYTGCTTMRVITDITTIN